jgi:hypothetical protein
MAMGRFLKLALGPSEFTFESRGVLLDVKLMSNDCSPPPIAGRMLN